MESELRQAAIEAAKRHFKETHTPKAFVPGETYIPVTTKVLDTDDVANLIDASLDMWLTTGRFAREFEASFARLFNSPARALLVNSGSSANLLAASAFGSPLMKEAGFEPLQRGDEVLTAAAGFPTTVNPILQNGWIPRFIDVEMTTLNASIEQIQQARTKKTRAIFLAHTLGNPYRSDQLAKWCDEEKLFLMEDTCDALGATIDAKPVGSFGHYATTSFYPAHHITMGEGGSVVAKTGRLRRVAESLRDWGRDCWCEPGKDNTCNKRFGWQLGKLPLGYDHKYTYSSIGYNLKATDMQAALGLSQLKKLPRFIEQRRQNWQRLYDGVTQSPVMKDKLIPVTPTPGTQPSWFGFPMHCAPGVDRTRMVRFLEERKIGTRLLFGGNLTKQPAYQSVNFSIAGDLKQTDAIMERTFWIGVHPALTEVHLNYLLENLEAACH